MAPRPVYDEARSQPSTDMLATSDEVGKADGRVTKVPNCAFWRQPVEHGRIGGLDRGLPAKFVQRVVGHPIDKNHSVFHEGLAGGCLGR